MTNETLAGANITALNGTFQMITENDTFRAVNLPAPCKCHPHRQCQHSTLQHVMHKIIPCTLQILFLLQFQDTSLQDTDCAMYSIRYVPGIRELTALVLDVIVTDEDPAYCIRWLNIVQSTYSLVQLYYYGLIAVDGQIWFYRINKDVS